MKVDYYQPTGPGQKVERQQVNSEEKVREMQEKMDSGKGAFHAIPFSTARRDAYYADYYAKHPEAASKSGVYPNPNTQPKMAEEPQITTADIPNAQEAKVRQSGASKPDWMNFAEYQAKSETDSAAAHYKAIGFDKFNYDEHYARSLETWMNKAESFLNTLTVNQGGYSHIKKIWQDAGYGLNDSANPAESWDELVAAGKTPKAQETATTASASEKVSITDEDWAAHMAKQAVDAFTKYATIDMNKEDMFNQLLALYQDVQKNGWTNMTVKQGEIEPLTEINVEELIGMDEANPATEA